jgi:hypothetical protein
MKRSRIVLLVSTLVLSLPIRQADAVQIFTDRTQWEAAVTALGGSLTKDPFENDIASALSITFDSGVVSTLSDPSGLDFSDNRVEGGAYHSAVEGDSGYASRLITWEFPFPIFAVGMDFFEVTADRLQIDANFDGTGVQQFEVFSSIGGKNGFLGFIGTSAFSDLIFSDSISLTDAFGGRNLAFAAAVAAVPEPASFFLTGVGLIAMSLLRIRRKN